MNEPNLKTPDDLDPVKTGPELLWNDGDMPYSTAFGDHFYCQQDGRLECSHVFLAGTHLPQRFSDGSDITIGELGFGTGLNAMETWRQWKNARAASGVLTFVSFELYPMRAADLDRALRRWPELDTERAALVSLWPEAPTGQFTLELDARTRLTIVVGPAGVSLPKANQNFDAFFLDGFAPSKNPDMWSTELMASVFEATKPGGRFATYAAAGFVRRNLIAAGFAVERRPGFGDKREMLCGARPM